MASFSFIAITLCLSSSFTFSFLPNMNLIVITYTISTTMITGVRWYTKAIKSSCAFDAIMIFGGSPISVAVPPIFDARASVIR